MSSSAESAFEDVDHIPELTPELRARLEQLSPEKRRLAIDRLLARGAQQRNTQQTSRSTASLAPVGRDSNLPLSFSQERIWVLSEMDRGDAAYNIPVALMLKGDLRPEILRRVLLEIVRRHEALRTRFEVDAGSPVQRIDDEATITLPLQDLTHLPEPERLPEVHQRASDEHKLPFDLRHGPLIRGCILRLETDRHVLLLTFHHIVADGWSMAIVVKELEALYRAFVSGADAVLPEMPIQYADYAWWQRELVLTGGVETDLRYWERELEDAPAILELPADHHRPPVRSSRGGAMRFDLGTALSQRLGVLAQEVGATRYMVLLAAFSTFLHRLTGRDDIVVGSPLAGRTRPELESLIGFFVNTLPMRCRLTGNPTFRELLARVKRTVVNATSHQQLPFEKLVEVLQPARNPSHTPIFQVMFGYQEQPPATINLPGLDISPLEIDGETSKFDLTLLLEGRHDSLSGVLEYSADLFEATTIRRYVESFQQVLHSIVESPNSPVDEISLLTSKDEAKILERWCGTSTSYPRDRSIQSLFEEEVTRHPESIALLGDEISVTYRELDERANRLSHRLIDSGITPGASVGICLQRSIDLIAGILAILKSGGVYVPLDPEYPRERLGFMMDDAAIRALVANAETNPHVKPLATARQVEILLVGNLPSVDSEDESNSPGVSTPADQIAYTMYTSGSTGKPKGADIPHRAILRLVKETDFVELSEREVFLQYAPVSFDASTLEIWGPLLNGGTLVIPPPKALSLDQLGEQIRKHGVTTLWLTSGLFNLMVDERIDDLQGLRQLLAGGDVLSVHHVQKALNSLPDTRLINGYGPTENTTFTCCFTIPRQDWQGRSIPIGRPIDNTLVYIVDASLRLTPPGVPGEILAGGDGLFLGYRNQPQLNQEKLIPNPFSNENEGLLYRTGDLGRYLEDGNIEFLGRMDDQVKIRGFRVEPREIESILLQHPDVRESVVVLRQELAHKELAAYVVRDNHDHREQNDADLVEALRLFVEQKLPPHLVPSSLTCLDFLPLSVNGKVDRHRLPEPSLPAATKIVAPQSATERSLSLLWLDVLGREVDSTDMSFFDVGGNSLLATQVVSRIRTQYALDMPLHNLFRYSTIRDLSAHIDLLGNDNLERRPTSTGIEQESGEATELSFSQERLWFLDRLEPDNPFYNVAFAHDLEGTLDVEALQSSFKALVRRHDVLRTGFVERDGQAHLQLHDDVELEIPVHDLRDDVDQESEILRRAKQEALAVFDLSTPPLLRVQLLVTGPTKHVLLVTMHHIVSDGWSLGLLIRELVAHYHHFISDEPIHLPELAIQYADFARWQRTWFTGEEASQQLAYWRQNLEDFPAELTLPTDRSRPPAQSFRGSSIQFRVDAETTRQLRHLCRKSDATMFMVLLSAFNVLLYRYTQQEDIIVGSPIANRNREEVESLIGFFVNTLPLRTDLSGHPTFAELVIRVRAACLDAFANQDYPFERLVDELQPERDLSRNPLFQVMFALQNAPEEELEIPGLSFTSIDLSRTAAQFDIVLDMWEQDEGLLGVFEFSTDLFDESTIVRMAGHFSTLMRSVVVDPNRPLTNLPLLTGSEQQRLLREFAGSRRSYPVERTIHALFVETVRSSSDRVAAIHGDLVISYTDLNKRANQIAWSLRAAGLQPNQPVAILEPRSIDFLAAMLGILKAGGAFMPVDAQYPADRIRHMLEDSQVTHLVSRSPLVEEHEFIGNDERIKHVILLDSPVLAQQPMGDPETVNTSRDLAYMLYTSGSTGLPRGAMIRHDGAVNHMFGEFDLLEFHADTVFLQSAPASSDISVWQFLGPLLKGGRTVIADYETVCDPVRLFELIRNAEITLIELVPVLLQEFLEYVRGLSLDERSLPDLEWAMVTGEAVAVPLVNVWRETYPEVPIVNAYGPTEASDDTCQFVVSEELSADRRSVPIGRPIANMIHYVLDPQLNLVPIGVPGEICVSGIGVGNGYWRDADKTHTSFVSNPFPPTEPGSQHHAVIYRTGDRGLWRTDGNLEYLERMDTQVKVRGFRIELGEIESLLSDHPFIRESAVIVREDVPGDRRLSAYVVPDLSSPQTQQELAVIRDEQIQLWQDLHENSYQSTIEGQDPTFNTIGWDSNYTGAPLPSQDMEEYVEHTVGRILSIDPGRVLEIGCGTGLIMFPLVPHCESYTGTDLSAVAIDQLKALQQDPDLRSRITGLEQITLLQRPAHDLSGFPSGCFDSVVLPSVVQYFPGVQYVSQLLESLIPTLAEGGSIFLGDVRSLGLLEPFHASVQRYKAEAEVPTKELLTRMRQRIESEQEMAIDPAFFLALKQQHGRVSDVEILPKRGRAQNEMTRYRYDVVIRLDRPAPVIANVEWDDWEAQPISADGIAVHLQSQGPALLALQNIRNVRVEQDLRALRLLRSHRTCPDKASLMAQLSKQDSTGIEPEDLWMIGRNLPYRVCLSMARSGEEGTFDALFVRTEQDAAPSYSMPEPEKIRPDVYCANNPLQERLARRIIPRFREFLRGKVPVYMVPSDFTLLSRMPVTPAGKIDRDALPEPDVTLAIGTEGDNPPHTTDQRRLSHIWSEVLDIDLNDVDANFFDLGGHSLKAVQVASRIHREFGVQIALRDLFNLPTVAQLATHLGEPDAEDFDELSAAEPATDYPLSHAQRRLWILSQINPTSTAYNMPASLLLRGGLDHRALARAFDELVRRHESLRTKFVIEANSPRQKIAERLHLQLHRINLSAEENPEARARELAHLHAGEPFDLAQGPLIRLSVLELSPQRHVLLFNMHHIIADDWSMGILVRELGILYDAFRQNVEPDLPDLRVHYKDYSVWQARHLASHEDETGRAFWLSQFTDTPEVLELPTDKPRPSVKTYHGRSVTHTLNSETADRLRAFSHDRGASLFMTLVACVNVLLHRHTGQEEVTIGLPTAGRSHVDLEGLIGFFINTLPLRMRIDPCISLQDFVTTTANRITACLENQMYPIDRLIDELDLRRDASRNPLYDVTVTLQNVDPYELSLSEVELSSFVEDYDMSKFDLSFSFQEVGAQLRCDLTYNSDLFLPQRIERMLLQFEKIAQGLLGDPQQTISQLDILPPSQRQQLIPERPESVGVTRTAETLTDWFARLALEYSDRLSILDGSDPAGPRLTYGELNERANQLARYLSRRGLKKGDRVGLYLDRSADVVVCILGILKAGGAYVPLDPMYPDERVIFMIEDARLSFVLTGPGLAARLQLPASVGILDIIRDMAQIQKCSTENPAVDVSAADPAYVIYTSGSTGRPKGVVVTHANVTRLFRTTEDLFNFSDADTWTLFHSYAFDFSVWEIWGALLYGGKLIIVPQALSRSPAEFLLLLEREKVTILNQTPSAFHQLITADIDAGSPPTLALRYVIFGGEALDHERLRPWFERRGDTHPQLVNMYGITETTVHVTYRPIRLGDLDRRGSLIGEALPDLRLYLVDRYGHPAPYGVAGEIWIGGDGVSEGYLYRDELTAQKFVSDPFADYSGKVYRSGDLARFLPDGEIEYLGRIDSQIQIRGFRVELGEIETCLASHLQIHEAHVVADQGTTDTRLLAYCLGDGKQTPTVGDLRTHLAGRLPDYMIPSHFIFLDAFPLTVNGKLDIQSLPLPESQHDQTETCVAAQNGTEEVIAEAFAAALGVTRVSRDANFFDLGAHSMSIIHVHRRLQQEHGMNVSVVAFYEFPTVHLLATHMMGDPVSDSTGAETDRAVQRRKARQRRRS